MSYTLISLKTSLMQYEFYKSVLPSSEEQVAFMQRLQKLLDLFFDVGKNRWKNISPQVAEELDITERVLECIYLDEKLPFKDRMLKFMQDYGSSAQIAHSSAGWLALGALHEEVSWQMAIVRRNDQAGSAAIAKKIVLSNVVNTVGCCRANHDLEKKSSSVVNDPGSGPGSPVV